ncbi:MAG: LptF/LptG family permease [Pelagibacteraceae bacterium]
MLKNKIYNYFTLELLKSFFTILFALTIIAWTVRAVNFLDLVVEEGHSLSVYLLFSALNITNIITKFIPLSFLLALMISIHKFDRKNELIILWSAGVNKIKLVNLFFFISLFVLLIQICFAVYITPNALLKSRTLVKSSNLGSLTGIIKSNDFSDSFDNLTFYIERKNENNEMENIFIRDDGNHFKNLTVEEKNFSNTTIIANRGFILDKKLILIDGTIQTQNKGGELRDINFNRTELLVNSLTARTITTPKLQETSTIGLLKCLSNEGLIFKFKTNYLCPKKSMEQGIIETISRRIGMPIYIPLISLITSFLLVSSNRKKFSFLRKYFYFFISFIILILAEILVRYSGFSTTNFFIYMFFPIILMPIIYLFLLRKFAYERL